MQGVGYQDHNNRGIRHDANIASCANGESIMMYDYLDYLSPTERRELHERNTGDGWYKWRGNAFVMQRFGSVYLRSYDTLIASFYTRETSNASAKLVCNKPTLWVVHNACDFSRTTCRHLSIWLSAFVGVDYREVKDNLSDMAIGECVELDNGIWLVCC